MEKKLLKMISNEELDAWIGLDKELSELEEYREAEDFGSCLPNQHLMN